MLAFVRPYVRRDKDDAVDAEAICEEGAAEHALRGGARSVWSAWQRAVLRSILTQP
jgi:hypothetical protein